MCLSNRWFWRLPATCYTPPPTCHARAPPLAARRVVHRLAMAADLAALKTELRAFERAFESEHGRAPTNRDLTPPQRELYRQYKQLKQLSLIHI